ncbi:MAG: hypothetical protein ACM30I_08085 [Gemmatimonas sp.]
MSALIDILKAGGCYWPATAPGRALAIPNRARFRVALDTPGAPPFAAGVCRDGWFGFEDGPRAGRAFESAPAAVEAVGGTQGDAYRRMEFLAGGHWMSADAIRGSGALPWDEADELALAIAIDAVRDKTRSAGEALSAPALVRKAAEVVAVSPYFLDEARQQLDWMKR